MSITKYTTFFIGLALAMVIVSISSIAYFGIKRGIDFTGGTVMEISYSGEENKIIDNPVLLSAGIKSYALSTSTYRFVTGASYEILSSNLAGILGVNSYTETQINTVGPTLGKEMEKKALIAIITVVFAILLFIAFSFRHVSEPVASWKYGLMAIVTLLHDIIVPTGVYVYLSHRYGVEVDTLFVVALLTIMGISISDKIVVFDRIRENLMQGNKKPFKDIVDISLRQTFTRSVNTSLMVVIALLLLFFYGPESTKYFSLTLMVGMIVGTYSSIFVASPALTLFVKTKKQV